MFLPLCIDFPSSAIANTVLDSVLFNTGFYLIENILINRTPEVQLMYQPPFTSWRAWQDFEFVNLENPCHWFLVNTSMFVCFLCFLFFCIFPWPLLWKYFYMEHMSGYEHCGLTPWANIGPQDPGSWTLKLKSNSGPRTIQTNTEW